MDDGQLLDCKVKGNFRIKGIRSTNPVAVGDRVTVGEGNWITEIEDRRNYIIRKSINLSKQSHILAANVDQAMLIVTVSKPETSTTWHQQRPIVFPLSLYLIKEISWTKTSSACSR